MNGSSFAPRAELLRCGDFGSAALDPPDGALLVFSADDAQPVEDFARNDPYVLNGLVKQWRVREWTVVVGG